jgi:hypothetical protein
MRPVYETTEAVVETGKRKRRERKGRQHKKDFEGKEKKHKRKKNKRKKRTVLTSCLALWYMFSQ